MDNNEVKVDFSNLQELLELAKQQTEQKNLDSLMKRFFLYIFNNPDCDTEIEETCRMVKADHHFGYEDYYGGKLQMIVYKGRPNLHLNIESEEVDGRLQYTIDLSLRNSSNENSAVGPNIGREDYMSIQRLVRSVDEFKQVIDFANRSNEFFMEGKVDDFFDFINAFMKAEGLV